MRRWRHAWRAGGADALRSRGPMAVERLSGAQWERLERELRRGRSRTAGRTRVRAGP
ncbi:hypothetical protein [Streptomyces phaeochromogenes]|uniref:hypothetical protein n=1 Tax=Streptomyces phaeochromogenes TaxID=1923 RepID=UPI00386A11D2